MKSTEEIIKELDEALEKINQVAAEIKARPLPERQRHIMPLPDDQVYRDPEPVLEQSKKKKGRRRRKTKGERKEPFVPWLWRRDIRHLKRK